MSATIMMPQEFDQAIRSMCGDAIAQATAALAEKYGFDAEEASRFLDLDQLKLVRKRGPSPKKTEEKPLAKSKAKAKTSDEPKTKRGPTGYLLYASSVRPEVRAEMENDLEEGEKVKPQEVVKAIAARWNELSKGEKDEWNTKAKTPVASDEEE